MWGPTYSPNPNLLRVHMTNIRRKLEQHPGAPTHFITDSGVGYRFENDSVAAHERRAGVARPARADRQRQRHRQTTAWRVVERERAVHRR